MKSPKSCYSHQSNTSELLKYVSGNLFNLGSWICCIALSEGNLVKKSIQTFTNFKYSSILHTMICDTNFNCPAKSVRDYLTAWHKPMSSFKRYITITQLLICFKTFMHWTRVHLHFMVSTVHVQSDDCVNSVPQLARTIMYNVSQHCHHLFNNQGPSSATLHIAS